MATIDAMGTLNSGWGICGFTSSLYALYQNNPTQRMKLAEGGPRSEIRHRHAA
jgi:hypothetical protein